MKRWLPILVAGLLMACSQAEGPAFNAKNITGSTLGANFLLHDGSGTTRRLADFRGKAVVIFFGWTRCPDVCPTTLATLARTMRLLESDAKRVQVIFITLDPERDKPEQLNTYVSSFDSNFLGLWGDPAATAATAKDFKVFYEKRNTGSGSDYAIDHFASSFAYDPAGQLRLLIPEDETPQKIAEDLRLLLAGR
jgi:protein SCO1/2